METGLFKINVYTPKILLTKQLVMDSFCEFDREMQKRNTKLFHNNTKKYMAQRFKELNKNDICFG